MKSELFQVIPNNGKRGAYYKSLQSIVVSNYHNLQNQFSRRSEWFVKLWLESQLRSYRCYLVTLTYKPAMCPVIDVSSMTYHRGYYTKGPKYNELSVIPVFDKRDKTLFFKKLRKRLGNGIKYLFCSEYGKNNTHRPHYHIFLMVPSEIECNIYSVLRSCWSWSIKYTKGNLIRYKNIPLGYINFALDSTGSAEVVSSAGFRYSSKYITKDNYLTTDSRFISLSNKLDNGLLDGSVSNDTYYRVLSLIRNHLPFHCSSKGFGKGWEEKYDVDSVLDNGFLIPTYNKKLNAFEDRYYKLPRSLFDNFFYDHKYLNFEKVRNYMRSSQFIHYLAEDLTFGLINYNHYYKYLNMCNNGTPFYYNYNDTLFYIVPDHVLDGEGISYPLSSYDDFVSDNKVRYHVRNLKPHLINKYFDLIEKNMLKSTEKESIYLNMSRDQILFLKWYNLVRTIIVPSDDSSFDFLNDECTLQDLKDIFYNSLYEPYHSVGYNYERSFVPELKGRTLNTYFSLCDMDQKLFDYLTEKLKFQENKMKDVFKNENLANIARDSLYLNN